MHTDLLTGVALFQYRLDAEGNLHAQSKSSDIPSWAAARRLRVVPMITNQLGERWDRDVVAHVLRDATLQADHIDRVVAIAVSSGAPAVEIDYESLAADDREKFASFLERLAEALHGNGKELSVAVHAKTSEPGAWSGAQAQDWARIGSVADRVVVMTYDFDPKRPGPIAPLSWTRSVLRLASSLIASRKVVQGIPLYGYDWAAKRAARDRTYRESMELAERHGAQVKRDDIDQHLWFEYSADGVRHDVWFVDAVTVAALASVGRELGVAGYALWRLGGEDPAIWESGGGIAGRE
jgi:spore germination protein YaaH